MRNRTFFGKTEIFLVICTLLALAGCASQPGAVSVLGDEKRCASIRETGKPVLRRLDRNDSGVRIESFTLAKPALICLHLQPSSSNVDDRVEILIDGNPLLAEWIPKGSEHIPKRLSAGKHNIVVMGAKPNTAIGMWYTTDIPIPDGVTFPDEQTCSGRLRGFAHPLGFHGQETMKRANVVVDCVMVFVSSKNTEQRKEFARAACEMNPFNEVACEAARDSARVAVVARGRTNSDGTFSVTITKDHFEEQGIYSGIASAAQLRTECHAYECGYEARGDIRGSLETLPNGSIRNADNWIPNDGNPDSFSGMDIVNVLHLVVPAVPGPQLNDLTLELVRDTYSARGRPQDPKESSQALLGARLLSNGQGAQRNDLPVIIHEQIDVLNIEHTNFMIWGLSGQVIELQGKGVKFPPHGCDRGAVKGNPEIEPYRQCELSEPDCNPTLCDKGDVRCLAYPLLQRLLNDGYDVWLVDNLQGRRDVMEVAVQGPALYETISRYSEVPTGIDISGDVVMSREPKRVAVAGISLGSVLARTALKLWEKRENLPDGLRVATAPLDIPTAPVEDRVALYASIDAPHLGLRIPLSLQAYIRDLPDIDEDVKRLKTRLNALPTRQFVADWVDNNVLLGCFNQGPDFNPRKDIRKCSVNHEELYQYTNREKFTDFFFRSVVLLDKSSEDPLGRMADGLPNLVPSIAISNGIYPQKPIDAGLDVVLNLKLKRSIFGFGVSDNNHWILDSGQIGDIGQDLPSNHQPGGSGFDGVCRAFRTSESQGAPVKGAVYGFGAGALAGGLAGGPLGAGIGGLAGLIGGTLTAKGTVSINVPMSPGGKVGDGFKGKAYPTLVPTRSSLLQLTGQSAPSPTWRDFFAPNARQKPRRHTAFENDQCKVLLYHLAGTMKGDKDGKPSCNAEILQADCRDGGMMPGIRLQTAGLAFPFQQCD